MKFLAKSVISLAISIPVIFTVLQASANAPIIQFKPVDSSRWTAEYSVLDFSLLHPHVQNKRGKLSKDYSSYDSGKTLRGKHTISTFFGEPLYFKDDKVFNMGGRASRSFYYYGWLDLDDFISQYQENAKFFAKRFKKAVSSINDFVKRNKKLDRVDQIVNEIERIFNYVAKDTGIEFRNSSRNGVYVPEAYSEYDEYFGVYDSLLYLFCTKYPVKLKTCGLMSEDEMRDFEFMMTVRMLSYEQDNFSREKMVKLILSKYFEYDKIAEFDQDALYESTGSEAWKNLRLKISRIWTTYTYNKFKFKDRLFSRRGNGQEVLIETEYQLK